MQEIPLSRGYVAQVDDEDYDLLRTHKWAAKPDPKGMVYASTNIKQADGTWKSQTMGRLLMQPLPEQQVIFRDYCGTNCQKSNLLVVTRAEALRHHRTRRDSTTGHKGIIYNEQARTYTARMNYGMGTMSLGTFESFREAVEAYDSAARRYGEAAALHCPNPGESSVDRDDLYEEVERAEAAASISS